MSLFKSSNKFKKKRHTKKENKALAKELNRMQGKYKVLKQEVDRAIDMLTKANEG